MDNFLEQLAALQSEEAVASLEGLQRLICETPLSWQSCTQVLEEILLALEKVAENNHIDLSASRSTGPAHLPERDVPNTGE